MKNVVVVAALITVIMLGLASLGEAASTCACERCVQRVYCRDACAKKMCEKGAEDSYFQGVANWIRWWPCSTKQVRECMSKNTGAG